MAFLGPLPSRARGTAPIDMLEPSTSCKPGAGLPGFSANIRANCNREPISGAKMKRFSAGIAVLAAITFSAAHASDKAAPHWSYEGKAGPAAWGKDFPTCGLGKAQAPIDIRGPFYEATQSIRLDYKAGPLRIINNGHTIQVNVAPGSKLLIGGDSYDLLQFHFHRPSEEEINGKPAAMVAHFVHRNAAGRLVVLGVLLNEGKENAALKTIWAAAPEVAGREVAIQGTRFNPARLIPKSLKYYRYKGSLTTPPCTEGVTFYILKTPATLSKAQVYAFPFEANARPVQPLNGRKIYEN